MPQRKPASSIGSSSSSPSSSIAPAHSSQPSTPSPGPQANTDTPSPGVTFTYTPLRFPPSSTLHRQMCPDPAQPWKSLEVSLVDASLLRGFSPALAVPEPVDVPALKPTPPNTTPTPVSMSTPGYVLILSSHPCALRILN